jgi:hypothetical protein
VEKSKIWATEEVISGAAWKTAANKKISLTQWWWTSYVEHTIRVCKASTLAAHQTFLHPWHTVTHYT